MGQVFMNIFNYIGSALPLAILCLCLATMIENKNTSSKALAGYAIISFIMFIILLRT